MLEKTILDSFFTNLYNISNTNTRKLSFLHNIGTIENSNDHNSTIEAPSTVPLHFLISFGPLIEL